MEIGRGGARSGQVGARDQAAAIASAREAAHRAPGSLPRPTTKGLTIAAATASLPLPTNKGLTIAAATASLPLPTNKGLTIAAATASHASDCQEGGGTKSTH